jgi:hypothetical protein
MESRPSKGKTDEKVATEIEDIMWRIYKKSRDNARTPMQVCEAFYLNMAQADKANFKVERQAKRWVY